MADLDPFLGHFISHSYVPGYIFLSFLVSFAGCWTALELLHKRTGAHGYHNWYLLLAAASVMGSVGIWSMHFIGNRAITMDLKGLPILYDPGFTAGSFFLPICGVGIAFYVFTITDHISILGTVAGGFLLGLAVCGMHYLGNGGISNFSLSYAWPFVLGAAIIAVTASTIALAIFFHLKSKWTNSSVKRALCASLLAGAVSGMHWTATVGTSYRLTSNDTAPPNGLSPRATIVIVICLSIGACLTLFALAVIGQRARARSSNRAQQVILASISFDPAGRLMVTPTGLLPCRKITDAYVERSFDEVFDVDHPVFCWCFRASRCWAEVTELIPGIRDHLRKTNTLSSTGGQASVFSAVSKQATDTPYSLLFKKLFLVAANELAASMQEPLEQLGVLFDEILSTGTNKSPSPLQRWRSLTKMLPARGASTGSDPMEAAEKGYGSLKFGKGQVLFTVRQVSRHDMTRLQSRGFQFADIVNISELLARSMEVSAPDFDARMIKMRKYTNVERMLGPGVHVGLFAIRPLVHRGFDVLVQKEANNMLPTTDLHLESLEPWQLEILNGMDNWTVAACCEKLRSASTPTAQHFVSKLLEGLNTLSEQIGNHFLSDARLIARPFQTPCRQLHGQPSQATVITFRVLTSVHEPTVNSDLYEFGPLRFFLCQQHTYRDSPDIKVFARNLHREFAGIVEPKSAGSSRLSNPRHSLHKAHRSLQSLNTSLPTNSNRWTFGRRSPPCEMTMSDNSSERSLVPSHTGKHFGGIKVHNEISIDISRLTKKALSHGNAMELGNSDYVNDVAAVDADEETFADRLLAITMQERRRIHS